MNQANFIVISLFALLGLGCQSGESLPPLTPQNTATASPPLVYIDAKGYTAEELLPPLLEASGSDILTELLLDRRLERMLNEREITLTQAQIQFERQQLMQALSEDEDQAERLLAQVLAQRGLGESRFDALLRRNAALRWLIQDDVQLEEAEVYRLYQLQYGPRLLVQWMLLPSAQEAATLSQRLVQGESFAQLALANSRDTSAVVGGHLPAFSLEDPALPAVLKQAVAQLEPGEVSGVLAIDQSFAIVRLNHQVPALDIPFEEVQAELTQITRLQVERRLMEQLARSLVEETQLVPLHPDVQRAWENRSE